MMHQALESLTAFRDFRDRLDGLLAEALERYKGQMQCKAGCFGCCRNDFRISLVEALEVHTAFQALETSVRDRVIANSQNTTQEHCPLLVEGQCSIYASRPLICRMFGFPISNGKSIGTCELNFTEVQDKDFTAQCFDGPLIGQSLQAISRLYLQETAQTLPAEDSELPMFRMVEVLDMSSELL